MSFDLAQGADALLAFLGRAEATGWDARLLGEVPDARAVVEYRFADAGGLALVGKFYADDTGQRTFRAMRELDATLAREPGRPLLRLPTPLFYDPRRRFLAQPLVEGTPYPTLLGGDDFRAPLRLAGQALALLHRLRVRVGRTAWLRDHLRQLIHPHPRVLCQRWPEYRAAVEALLAGLAERERAWLGLIEGTPIHRDFHLRQLFHDQGRVCLIDWDLFARGDAALDVGNFLVYLETHLGEQAAACSAAFLDGYCANHAGSVLERVPVYKAFTYLRLACKRVRLGGNDWHGRVWHLLRRAEQSLAATTPC